MSSVPSGSLPKNRRSCMSAFIAVFLSSFISSRVLSLSLVFLHVLHLRRLVRSRGHLRLFPRQRRHEQVPHFSRVCRSFSPRKSRGRIPICAFRSQNAGLVTKIYNCANAEVIHLTYEKIFKSMTPAATFISLPPCSFSVRKYRILSRRRR